MKAYPFTLLIFLVLFNCLNTMSQESKLLPGKAGVFKLKYFDVYERDECNYTKTETAANYQKLLVLTALLRRNPVIGNPEGFDCVLSKTIERCMPQYDYGIPCQVWIDFCSWSMESGREICWTSEPPEWYLNVNRLRTFGAAGFNVTTDEPSQTKPGFNMEQWEKSADKVNELFYMPGEKETVGKGIDRYKGDFIIIYNPVRPANWEQVKIRETFELLFDYWRKHPNQLTSETMVKMLEKEYAVFSESEKGGYAYFGDPNSIFRIGSDSRQLPVMRVNPAYWNKSLPRSDIQFISFNCPADKESIKIEKEERLKNNNGYYHLSRFIEALDITGFPAIINK